MTENQPTPADRHDLPDDTRGPDTPTKLDDPGTMMARNQPPRDEPAEGRGGERHPGHRLGANDLLHRRDLDAEQVSVDDERRQLRRAARRAHDRSPVDTLEMS